MKILELTGGIKHIEDLPLDKFLDFVTEFSIRSNDPTYCKITEKIDGSALGFGLDSDGKFYTDRCVKNGERYYDWPIDFWTTSFSSAHNALKTLAENLQPGDRFDAEIINGQTNVVPYYNFINRIILLHPTSGNTDIDLLVGNDVYVEDSRAKSVDGKTIVHEQTSTYWTISSTPQITPKLTGQLNEKINDVKWFLSQHSKVVNELTHQEISNINLTKRPARYSVEEWKIKKPLIKEERNKINNVKLLIKETLLNEIVRNLNSGYGSSWVEGVVVHLKETGEFIKIVDKQKFTEEKNYQWRERNKIFGKNSLVGKLHEDMANIAGLPTGKAGKEQITENMDEIASGITFDETRIKWMSIIDESINKFYKMLSEYKNNPYDGPAHNKTLLYYAAAFKTLSESRDNVLQATTSLDLLKSF